MLHKLLLPKSKDKSLSNYIYRRVITNALQCALDQIVSNRFEVICIRSIHTLVTESKFNYGLRKLYCVGVW